MLRRANRTDAPALADIYLAARRAAAPGIPPMAHAEHEVRAWIADVMVPRLETWLAEDGGAAHALMVLDGDELDQLYVDPTRQGQGLGAALLGLAQGTRETLTLWTFATNHGARRFYERHGFQTDGVPDCANEEGAPALRYRWRRS